MAENPDPPKLPFKFRDLRQQRIYRGLGLLGLGAPAFYKDACRLREEKSDYEATTHLIGHLLREIQGSLRDVLLVFVPSIEVPDSESLNWQIRQILMALDVKPDDQMGLLWLKYANTLAKKAHRDNLQAPRLFGSDFETFQDEMDGVFDFILARFEAKYTTIHEALDELIKTPSKEGAKWLKIRVPNNQAALGYFFDKLDDPNWLPFLQSGGLFKRPPEPVFEPEKQTTFYPPWALTKCLIRMAKLDDRRVKECVATILLGINTNNFIIHLDIVNAACSLPIDLAERVARRETDWLEQQRFVGHLIPDTFASIAVYLAEGNRPDTAIAIATSLLGFVDDEVEDPSAADNYFAPDPRTRLDRWDYGQFIHKTLSSLAASDWVNTLKLFCNLLSHYLDRKHPDSSETGQSYSYIWHRAIDQDEDEIPSRLVSAIRRISELALEKSRSNSAQIVEILDSYKWDVFSRVVLYLLHLYGDAADTEIRNRLINEANFRDPGLFHEYVLLLNTFFRSLPEDEAALILHWIDTSPSSPEEIRERNSDRELTDDEVENYIRGEKLRWLEPLVDVLPEEWLERYENWVADVGHPPHPSFLIGPIETTWGNGEPVASDVLSRFDSAGEIAGHLSNPADELEDLPARLGRELEQLVREDPQKFAPHAELFKDLAPVYVRSFMSGIRSAMEEFPEAAWPNLLELMAWVMSQPAAEVEISGTRFGNIEQDWLQTRDLIGDFVSSLFSKEGRQLPFSFRELVWGIIEGLTEDPNPTPAYEARYGGRNMDPLMLSMNTIRGNAFHTLSKYLFWCRENLESLGNQGLESTPEVARTLERHLDPAVDESLTVRAVYGQQLPYLVTVDPTWIADHLDDILPNDPDCDLLKSAWQTFVIYNRPWDNVFPILEAQYERAINRIGESSLYRSENPENHLAQHLIIFYARGLIDIEDDGLIDQLYARASDGLAAHIFWFIGRVVREGTTPDEVLSRFVRLINLRIGRGQRGHREMEAFGWIFDTGRFDAKWSLERMVDTLQVSGSSETDHSIIEDLSKLTKHFPKLTLECLRLLIEGADTEWKISYWSPHIRTAITHAIGVGEVDTAVLLINKLAARGFVDFRDLLP